MRQRGNRTRKSLRFPLTLLFALCWTAEAQQATNVPRIGVLRNDTPTLFATRNEALRQGLRELGYVDGKNIIIEYRYAEGKVDRLPRMAADLINRKVDVIVVGGGTIAIARKATTTIPIVVGSAGDLLGGGYVASLAKPVKTSRGQRIFHRM